ncbi:1676_t:CDS:1, partial [Gigaspora rosea]
ARKSMNYQNKIKPLEDTSNKRNMLQYIRNFYEKLYESKEIDKKALYKITKNLFQ